MAPPRGDQTSSDRPDLGPLADLAARFVAVGRPDEATQLLEIALRLDPGNLPLQLALAEVKQAHRSPIPGGPRSVELTVREQLRRQALDAKHFLGLAYLYVDRNEEERALQYLEIAAARDLPNHAPHKLHARLLLKRGDFRRAIPQLRRARRFNPFDRETCELLGVACAEIGEHADSLASWVDAFLLLPAARRPRADELKRRIQEARARLGWSNEQLHRLFRERQEELRVAFDRLEWHRRRFLEEGRLARTEHLRPSRRGRIDLAARLRQLDVWSHFTDEQIFQIAGIARDEEHPRDAVLFPHGSDGRDLYVLERGEIAVRRPTAYGSIPIGLIKAGELFGEVAYLTGGGRSGEVVTSQPSQVIRVDAAALDALVDAHPDLGLQIAWSFWHGLAFKLRCTNEQLKTFFDPVEHAGETVLDLRRLGDEVRQADVPEETKAAILREGGLTGPELSALARVARERRYAGGGWIFREGETGKEMFVVVDGKVRIGKRIPGAGEEALTILSRGDFFGEMAMIDGQPRSADARAHGGPATVIAVSQEAIRDLLARDPAGSLQLLRLLCRLVAARLREIDEKLVGWRIMSGHVATAG